MNALRMLLVSATVLATTPASADTPAEVNIVSARTTAVIRPIPEGQRLINLPALDYALTIAADCGTEAQVESLSISIADSSRTVDKAVFDTAQVVTIEFTVPSRQLSPVAVGTFCRVHQMNDSADVRATLDAAVTANLSLRCAGADHATMVYASEPLDVSLVCDRDQPPSDSPIAR